MSDHEFKAEVNHEEDTQEVDSSQKGQRKVKKEQKVEDDDDYESVSENSENVEEKIEEKPQRKVEELQKKPKSNKMNECYGCKTFFEEGQKLPDQDLYIQLKNYYFPIKDQKTKWNLLKAICAYLNSKGGTIYVGVEDKDGKVMGNVIQRKEQDEFKLFIKQLVQRIQPKIDLTDREEIIIQYVPIYSKSHFKGKYVIKIIVKQGDPSKLYCFSQKVQMMSGDKKTDQYQVVYSYKRHNMGGTNTLKGLQLVQQATNKALNPIKVAKTFHEDCNPEPLHPTLQILKIGFGNIYVQETRRMLQQWFEQYLHQLKINDYSITYESKNDILMIEFEDKKSFNEVLSFVEKNIGYLNQELNNCEFEKKNQYLDCMLFKNEKQKPKVQKKVHERRQERQEFNNFYDVLHEDKKSQPKPKQPEKKNENTPKKQQPVQVFRQELNKNEPPKQKIPKKHCLTFTHIEPKLREQFVSYLDNNIIDVPKQFQQYENTIQVFFSSEEDKLNYVRVFKIQDNSGNTEKYGFKRELNYGNNLGLLIITNYDKKKWQSFTKFLQKQIGRELKQLDSDKNGNTYSIHLQFHAKENACKWLDILLKSKKKNEFKIPGSEVGNAAKMKIRLMVHEYI